VADHIGSFHGPAGAHLRRGGIPLIPAAVLQRRVQVGAAHAHTQALERNSAAVAVHLLRLQYRKQSVDSMM
jgi:hypothetical protein